MRGVAGIVLAGGRSSRMGRPKAGLEWLGTTLVAHTVAEVSAAVDGPVIVVRAPGQDLSLPAPVEVTEDAREGRGPLEALAAGLRAVGERADCVYLSATDVPFLQAAFVRCVSRALAPNTDAAVPRIAGRVHALAATYRTSVLPDVEALLAADELRLTGLLERISVRWLGAGDLLADPALRRADRELASLWNVNTPADYDEALAAAGSRAGAGSSIRPGCE